MTDQPKPKDRRSDTSRQNGKLGGRPPIPASLRRRNRLPVYLADDAYAAVMDAGGAAWAAEVLAEAVRARLEGDPSL